MPGKVNLWLALTVAALLGVIVGMVIGAGDVTAASSSSSPATTGHLTALAGHVDAAEQPIYLIDSREQVLLVYEYGLGQNGLKFVAARTFQYDKLVDDFNIQDNNGENPTPDQVKKSTKGRRR